MELDLSNKPKTQQEEILSNVQLKSIEKVCLERVFDRLCKLQEEVSSDDNSKEKKYLSEISKKANAKKMKKDVFNNKPYASTTKFGSFKVDKKFKEEDTKGNSLNSKISASSEEPRKRIGMKAIRKIIRQLEEEISPEEIQLMIWVNNFIKFNIKISINIIFNKINLKDNKYLNL